MPIFNHFFPNNAIFWCRDDILTSPPPPPPPQLNRNYDGGGGKQMTDWHFSNYDTTDLKKWWWPCWLISCMTLDKYLQRRLVLSTTKQQQGRRKVWKYGGGQLIMWVHKLPPGWGRVNWYDKKLPPAPRAPTAMQCHRLLLYCLLGLVKSNTTMFMPSDY